MLTRSQSDKVASDSIKTGAMIGKPIKASGRDAKPGVTRVVNNTVDRENTVTTHRSIGRPSARTGSERGPKMFGWHADPSGDGGLRSDNGGDGPYKDDQQVVNNLVV